MELRISASLHCIGVGEAVSVDEMIYLTRHRPGQPWCGANRTPYAHSKEILQPNWITVHGQDLAGYQQEVAYFAECLREGRPPQQGANLWDGAKSLELTEAIYQSATADGERVEVPVR